MPREAIAPGGLAGTRSTQREPQGEPTRKRRRNAEAISDRYYIDPRIIPAGMSYEWKRLKVAGMEDGEHQGNLMEYGAWTHVPAERHPELAGKNAKPGSMIIRGDNVLMERPVELTREAQSEDLAAARAQTGDQYRKLGLAPDNTLPRTPPKARREYEPVEIPDDETEAA